MRTRTILLLLGFVLVPFTFWLTDPDTGLVSNLGSFAGVVNYLVYVSPIFLFIGMWFIARKLLFDYPEADFRLLLKRANDSATGAGLALVSIAIMMLGVAVIIYAVVVGKIA